MSFLKIKKVVGGMSGPKTYQTMIWGQAGRGSICQVVLGRQVMSMTKRLETQTVLDLTPAFVHEQRREQTRYRALLDAFKSRSFMSRLHQRSCLERIKKPSLLAHACMFGRIWPLRMG